MRRLAFLVNRGEKDCYMVHGLDWATYAESDDWNEITRTILSNIDRDFPVAERPSFLDFKFPDGTIVSYCA